MIICHASWDLRRLQLTFVQLIHDRRCCTSALSILAGLHEGCVYSVVVAILKFALMLMILHAHFEQKSCIGMLVVDGGYPGLLVCYLPQTLQESLPCSLLLL